VLGYKLKSILRALRIFASLREPVFQTFLIQVWRKDAEPQSSQSWSEILLRPRALATVNESSDREENGQKIKSRQHQTDAGGCRA